MKKILTISVIALGTIALVAGAAFAGPSCGAKDHSKTSASKDSQVDAKFASSKAKFCTASASKACAEKMGISEEECRALCESGDLTKINMSIKGMTCGSCEGKVTASLEKVPGVVAVESVDYKTGTASVYLDTRKSKENAVLTAVANTGFEVEVIPAVAKLATASGATNAGAKFDKASCESKKGTAAAGCCSKDKGASAKQIKAESSK